MASTGKKIALGCGIGCLLLALIVGGIGTCAYLGIRDVMDEAENLDVVYDDLAAVHGPPEAYTPPADGHLEPARIETFLAVRDSLREVGTDADRLMRILDDAEGAPAGPLDKIRAGMGFIPAIIRYMATHSRTLLDEGMGLGEYAYVYALGYYVMLGHDPGAGPDFELEDDPREEKEPRVTWSTDGDTGDARQRRAQRVRQIINRLARHILENQRDAAVAADLAPEWIARLDRELVALRDDWRRLPWEDGLPEPLAESFLPYRDALAETWSPYLNALDVTAFEE